MNFDNSTVVGDDGCVLWGQSFHRLRPFVVTLTVYSVKTLEP